MQKTMTAALATLALAAGAAMAHGDAKELQNKAARPISTEEKSFGREGDPRHADRTVRIDMADAMRFSPPRLTVKRGETVKFVVRNNGKLMHEMVLGTLQELKDHGAMMKKHPTMEHDEPYMAHVAPGATRTIVWQFTRAGEFYFGCLVPGHLEAGMLGKINIR